MAFKATITLNGKDYNLVNFSMDFTQEIGKNGKPASVVKGGSMSMTLFPDGDTTFAEWMLSDTKTMHGEVNFYSPEDSEKVLRKLKFTKAYCTKYEQDYNYDLENSTETDALLYEKVTLSAGKIEIGDVEHDNKWPN